MFNTCNYNQINAKNLTGQTVHSSLLTSIYHRNIKTKLLRTILFSMGLFWMNIANSQPIVKVWGVDNSEPIEKRLQLYLAYLDVHENVFVSVNFYPSMPYHSRGATISYKSNSPVFKQVIQVLVDAHAYEQKRWLILAHEMIHVKQFAKNELIANDHHKIFWKGKMFVDFSCSDPHLPWEREAREHEKFLVRYLKN